MRLRDLQLLIAVATAVVVWSAGSGAAAPVAVATHSAGYADAPTANLWIDANGGRCARSATAAAYRDDTACASIDAAWDACRPGDRIVMRSGVYGGQAITGDKAAPGCTVRGEGDVTIGDLLTAGAYFTLDNVTVDVGTEKQAGWKDRASNVTLRNVRLHGPFVTVDIYQVHNVSWLGGELGTAGQIGGARVCGQDAQPVQIGEADHVTISGITFHRQDADLTPSPCSSNGQHLEMVRIDGGTSFLTLRNSTFESGDHSNTASVFITEPGGSIDPHDLTFEDNFFGTNEAAVGAFEVHRNVSPCANFTFAYNTFLESLGAFECASSVNMRWIGNLGPKSPDRTCDTIRIGNVWQDTSKDNCGRDKWVNGPRGQTNRLGLGGSDGFHLQPGSPAIDAGEAAGYCTTALGSVDRDGGRRQFGTRCDAGADEYDRGPAVVASLARTRWKQLASGSRTFTATLDVDENVAADVQLVRGARMLAQARDAAVEVGVQRTILTLPASVLPGGARVRVALKDAGGNRRVIERPVKIPGRRAR